MATVKTLYHTFSSKYTLRCKCSNKSDKIKLLTFLVTGHPGSWIILVAKRDRIKFLANAISKD